ncbi:MAG: hypothetical protein FWC61_00510 [Proteobacteria bacterium]|nr:hypothetical protein [Pseudomonadota bacterium]
MHKIKRPHFPLLMALAVFVGVSAVSGRAPAAVATKAYVDRIVSAFAQPDWNQTDTQAGDYIKNKPVLAAVAISGDYNDLVNIPGGGGNGGVGADPGTVGTITPGALYSVKSNGISGAVTNDSFYVEMDGLKFKATKQSTANYWAVRLVNNTAGPVTIGSAWLQLYGAAQSINKESVNMAVGAELNPDNEAGDLGYGREDTAIIHIFDVTNRHLYRWTVTVYVNNAIIVVEKLY